MADNFKNSIEDYSMDYREKKKDNIIKNKPITQTVIAGQPVKAKSSQRKKEECKVQVIKNSTLSNIKLGNKIKKEQIINFNQEEEKEEIYINLKNDKSSRIKIIMYSIFILFLTIVGVVILTSNIDRTVPKECYSNDILNSLPLTQEQEALVYPAVIADIDEFKSIEQADKGKLLAAAIWKLILENGAEKYNNFDEKGLSLISKQEVEDSLLLLFGPECKVDFSNKIEGSFFYFDPKENNFHITAVSNSESYFPYIKNIEDDNDTIILEVGYVSPYDNWLKEGSEKSSQPSPVKYLKYKLKKNKKNCKIYIYSCKKIC